MLTAQSAEGARDWKHDRYEGVASLKEADEVAWKIFVTFVSGRQSRGLLEMAWGDENRNS